MAAVASGSILAVDFGSVQTRAVLIDQVEGVYRLVGMADTPTTTGFPFGDATLGLKHALMRLSDTTGRKLLDEQGHLITPEDNDRAGVDILVATASIGRPLRTVILGLLPATSIASALRVTSGTYAEVVDVISLEDVRDRQAQLNALVLDRPDLIFVVGGTDDGAKDSVIDMARLARLAYGLLPRDQKPALIYAGNSALIATIEKVFDGVRGALIADNVRPLPNREILESAQAQLAAAYEAIAARSNVGLGDVAAMSRVGLLPTAQSYSLLAEFLGRTVGDTLLVDVGSAISTLAASLDDVVTTRIRTDVGVGHSLMALYEQTDLNALRAWLPFEVSGSAAELANYAHNKPLRPSYVPDSLRTLYIEHAFVRAALQALIAGAKPIWHVPAHLQRADAPLPPFQRIVGAGAALAGTGRPGLAAMLLLDGLQPQGVTQLQLDPGSVIAALGALARVNPEAAVQVLDGGGLQDLGTCINLSGYLSPEADAVRVRVRRPAGDWHTETVMGGALWVYPLSSGARAEIDVRVLARGATIGGRGAFKGTVMGGAVGVIIDTRGRPLPTAASARERAEHIPVWYAAMTGDPVRAVPADWMFQPDEPIPDIEAAIAAIETQRGKRGKVKEVSLKDFNLAAETKKDGKRGRRSKAEPVTSPVAAQPASPAAKPNTGSDIDDLRELFP